MIATRIMQVEDLSRFIRQRRNALDMTQADLAEELTRLGYLTAASTIGGWETGSKQPPLEREFVSLLAMALQTTRISIYKAAGVFDQSPAVRREAFVNMLPDFTEDELDEMEDFAEFILMRRAQRRKE